MFSYLYFIFNYFNYLFAVDILLYFCPMSFSEKLPISVSNQKAEYQKLAAILTTHDFFLNGKNSKRHPYYILRIKTVNSN